VPTLVQLIARPDGHSRPRTRQEPTEDLSESATKGETYTHDGERGRPLRFFGKGGPDNPKADGIVIADPRPAIARMTQSAIRCYFIS